MAETAAKKGRSQALDHNQPVAQQSRANDIYHEKLLAEENNL